MKENSNRQRAAEDEKPPRIPQSAGLNLNTATAEEVGKVPGIDPDKIWDLMHHRPYRDWGDLKRVPGISDKEVEVIRRSGVVLGP